MKVFWSWQSDTPGNIGRHFIRKVLEDALGQLKTEDELEEPERNELHLDHDRKGVPGSPDLAQAILEKIESSSVFIADVTPVGKTEKDKALINSNVAIELGYALSFVQDSGLLMVLNEAYGERNSLPFDLRHKAGPIVFKLSTISTKEEIAKEHSKMVGVFRTALRDCLEAKRSSVGHASKKSHDEINTIRSPAEYFEPEEILARRRLPGLQDDALCYRSRKLIYLRVIPTEAMEPMRQAEITDLICGIKVPPLRFLAGMGGYQERN